MSRTYFSLPCAIAIHLLTPAQREALIARCHRLGADVYKGWYTVFNSNIQECINAVNDPFNYTAKNAYLTASERRGEYFLHIKTDAEFSGQGGAVYSYSTFMAMTNDTPDIAALLSPGFSHNDAELA